MWRLKRCSVAAKCRWLKPSFSIHAGPSAQRLPTFGTVALFGFSFWNPKATVAAIIMSVIGPIHGLGLPPGRVGVAGFFWKIHPEKAYSARRPWKKVNPDESAGSAGLWQC